MAHNRGSAKFPTLAATSWLYCLQSSMRILAIAIVLAGTVSAVHAQPAGDCSSPAECRQLTLDAIARGEYERAHDFAWRVVQTSPRRDRDPDALALLARAQSLSGRGYDSFVMLQRLADMGVVVDDAAASDDFTRAREYPGWTALAAEMTRLAEAAKTAAAKTGAAKTGAAKGEAARGPSVTPAPPAGRGSGDTPKAPPEPASASASKPGTPAAAADAPPATEVSDAGFAPLADRADALTLPGGLSTPSAMAHDAVSARFLLAGGTSDVLQVLSETSGNATGLVRAGWSGHAGVTALAIDRRSGDLWVASQTGERAAIHRLQLISGRLLETLAVPTDLGAVRVTALALASDTLFVLDAAGQRILGLPLRAKTFRVQATLPDAAPSSFTFADGGFYVADARGLVRVDLATGARRRLASAATVDVSNLHSLGWHNGMLLAIRGTSSEAAAVRVRVNARRTSALSVQVIEPAAATTATVSGDLFCYIARREGESGLACQSLRPAK